MKKNYRDQSFLEKVGKKIVEIRNAKKITQEGLAELTGFELRQIGRIERAEINTSLSTIKAIATALDVKINEIVDV